MKKRIWNVMITVLLIAILGLFFVGCSSEKDEVISEKTPIKESDIQPTEDAKTDDTNDTAKSEKVVFVTGEWAPYVSETLPNKGSVTELVEAICMEAGIEYEIQFVPWERAEEMVKAGEAFAAFPYAVNAERKAIYNVSDTIFQTGPVIAYYSKNANILEDMDYVDLSSFVGFTFVQMAGDLMIPELEKNGIEVETTATVDSAIKMLYEGRADFTIDNLVVILDAVSRVAPDETENLKTLTKPFGEKNTNALIVSRVYPETDALLKQFNEGLAAIVESGKYDEIANKYGFTK